MRKAFAALLLAVALAAGVPSAFAFDEAAKGVAWTVVEIDGSKTADDAGVLTFQGNKLSGRAACNRLFGEFHAKAGDGLTFGPIGTTRKMCEGRMELERQLLGALEKVRAFKLEGPTLTLLGEGGGALVRLVQ